ncbi:metal-dependent transcriptional regulator [Lactiplantibacillus plajomi]|uniref:Metal-dependent transcriptional regulator n=1 Tax=Lactiplantibacillus plajomi TaxID=1457217 RepID=A0ABV6K409_9LACO|nr:metal-dependent transcriptional regulator [Lactiplantibacillus plajomi]
MRKSISNYLKTIYEAGFTKTGTTNKQVATMLGVLPGSVTEAVSNLEKQGLVTRKTYHEIALTRTGYQLVKNLMFRYRLCEVWLSKIIKLPLSVIPEQAWLMAAINNQELLDRLHRQLDQPLVSPFGGALALPDFDQQASELVTLDTVTAGQTVLLASYLETASTIKYWQHAGLQLNQTLTVTHRDATIPMLTLTSANQTEYLVDTAVARYVYVQPQTAGVPV